MPNSTPPRTEPLRTNPNVTVTTLPAEPIKPSQSGTIKSAWAGLIVTIVGFILTTTKLSADQQKTIMDFIELLLPYLGIAAAFVGTWYHRRQATQPIEGGPADPQVMATNEIRRMVHKG